jgi:hypothetical protein
MRPVKRLALWAVVVPLMLAGTEVAHALAYRIVYPIATVRWHVLATTGHGYMGYAPLLFGIGGAVVLAGFLATVVDAARRRPSRSLPAWAFALLPLVGYTIQEFAERLLATGVLPWWMFHQPTFRVGLLLQLPFSLLTYLAARLLLRVGRSIGRLIADRVAPPVLVGVLPSSRPAEVVLRPLSLLRCGWGVRGPPLPSV